MTEWGKPQSRPAGPRIGALLALLAGIVLVTVTVIYAGVGLILWGMK